MTFRALPFPIRTPKPGCIIYDQPSIQHSLQKIISILSDFMVISGIVSSSGTKKEAEKNWIRRFWGATDTYTITYCIVILQYYINTCICGRLNAVTRVLARACIMVSMDHI